MTSDHNDRNEKKPNIVIRFGRLVRFTHTVFALPFALSGLALAARETPFRWMVLLWVLLAMVAARSAAMGFNRIVDRRYDRLNPRTANREIPNGSISVVQASAFVLFSVGVFIASAFMLNPLCGWLSPVALAILFFYSVTKRFTWMSQFFLGLSLAVAPVGAWLALSGAFDIRIFALSAAVLLWVAGFDIFYSCLDMDFDKKHGLFSIPQRWGLSGGIWLARLLHLVAGILLLSLYWLYQLGPIYLGGIIIVIIVLAIEGFIVKPNDLSRAMLAFNLNGAVSILFFIALLLDVIM